MIGLNSNHSPCLAFSSKFSSAGFSPWGVVAPFIRKSSSNRPNACRDDMLSFASMLCIDPPTCFTTSLVYQMSLGSANKPTMAANYRCCNGHNGGSRSLLSSPCLKLLWEGHEDLTCTLFSAPESRELCPSRRGVAVRFQHVTVPFLEPMSWLSSSTLHSMNHVPQLPAGFAAELS